MTQPGVRPQFLPSPCGTSAGHTPLQISCTGAEIWTPIISCPAPFAVAFFEKAVEQLVHHPEYNSTLILRSETLSDVRNFSAEDGREEDAEMLLEAPMHCDLKGYKRVRAIRRRLLPRRPGRDASLEQTCVFYTDGVTTGTEDVPSLLVLTPILKSGEALPYYHPAVKRLAVRYVRNVQGLSVDESEMTTLACGMLFIEAVLLRSGPTPPDPPDPNSRLYRTCLALLDTVHRYGWGALTHYRKRVHHDVLVPREVYQDLYLVLRERYKHLVSQWKEATDPAKHVFEDVGIATFLMLLWKTTYGSDNSGVKFDVDRKGTVDTNIMPWRNWPRPRGGFLDLGCGNGLLVHILVSEGYAGHGIDVRARQSWSHYPEVTRKALHVHPLDPTCYVRQDSSRTEPEGSTTNSKFPDDTKNDAGTDFFKPGVFLIGNHADELTPWVPVLATLCDASGYLSIPCCAWGFDERFTRSSTSTSSLLSFYPGSSPQHPSTTGVEEENTDDGSAFIETLNLGAEGTHTSQYSVYRIWLARLSQWMGWKVECEVLRIPSTRNWGNVGRERSRIDGDEDGELYKERAREIVGEVVRRGVFKTRKPEGKAGDH
ncbi:hypothetical protein PISMIDRAFT_641414 [Pisolithus microcarpus 441]|uniref:tRNA (uracil-O(2)-)-methyltransferase n=1 Tax=Pisolithus microcarpus 441 TaxID=765257 RepID=A0A0C9ZI73_9AGAM|nr:hypothetical protein BKA83DRAFT_641414 [Pisolithus microcarpus]KIK25694.1 hypothetical protein PISMIDRAFT_641414 [Pisolithus microcarpus 441]